MDNQRYILKVFSGPHLGAEALLEPGDYEVGRSEQCDIIFNDAVVAQKHALLSISSNGLTVAAIEQPVYVDGKAVSDSNGGRVDLYQAITVGTTHFGIGLDDEDWPQIRLPELPVLADMAGQKDEDVRSLHSNEVNAHRGKQGKAFEAGEIVRNYLQAAKFKRFLPGAKINRFHLTGGIGLLVSCAVFGFTVDYSASTSTRAGLASSVDPLAFPSRVEQVRRVVAELKMGELKVAEHDGQVEIQGYLPTAAQRRKLENKLQPLGSNVQQKIWVGEDQVSSASTILSALGLNQLEVSDGGHGTLKMHGYVEDAKDWHTAQATLRKDLIGIISIDDRSVETREHRMKSLQRLLTEAGLADKVDLATKNGQLIVKGLLSAGNMQRLTDVTKKFSQRYAGRPPLRSQVALIKEDKKNPELTINGIVSTGPRSVVMSKAGQRYKVGDVFPDGFKVKAIESKRVVLSRNNQTVVRYLGGGRQ